MLNIRNNMSYAIVKNTNKLSILLILVMLFSSVFNIGIIAERDPKPDLYIQSLEFDDTVAEEDLVIVEVLIKNQGEVNISAGIHIEVALRIDGSIVATNSTDVGLPVDQSCYINISWIAERGDELERLLEVEVDYNDIIPEEIEYNNVWASSIKVSERNTDLTFIEGIIVSGRIRVGEPVTLSAFAKNIGKNTTKTINVTLFVNNIYYDDHKINGLSKGKIYAVYFEWIPDKFGDCLINITIDPKNEIDEQDESNNFLEQNKTVESTRLEWWDTSWHYRKFYDITSTGNVSVYLNSTELLDELQITGATFEDDTVTVVKYLHDGTLDGVVSNYTFNESGKKLIWQVTQAAYYCVYFDVMQNRGDREGLPEILDMNESGNVQIGFTGLAEGWWFKPLEEFRTYYTPGPPYNQMFIQMRAMAETCNATATLYWNENIDHVLNLTTGDNLTWFENYMFSPLKIGNWSITIDGYDDAGYKSEVFTHDFFVGFPDLTIDSLTIYSELPEGSPNYEDNDYIIKANVLVYNATAKNVNVTLLIDGEYIDTETKNITKDQNNMVSFLWHAEQKGTYNVTVVVDYNTSIDESNEDNNKIWESFKIEGIPDLDIINITVPSEIIEEGSPAEIFVEVTNIGEGNATNYQVNLYLEQHDKNEMSYTGLKAQISVDIINISETKNVSLIWTSAQYGEDKYDGEWVVGAIVVWDETHPDSNTKNNRDFNRTSRLKINATEQPPPPENNDPIIKLLKPKPLEKIEQNTPVEILAKITDESGIKKVEITITDPEDTTYAGTMTKQENDKYSYTFENTSLLKIYTFTITAFDNSSYGNDAIKRSNFAIVEDATPPEIEYIGVLPSVQLKDKDVTISCITSDRSGVKFVQVTITYPDGSSETKNMTNSSGDIKYYFTQSYEMLGRYVFYITVEDVFENEEKTDDDEVEFWITTDLEDTDNDGMPDWWEEKYGFDPFNPADATEDEDDDGYTNVEEHEEGTDPLKPLSLLEKIVIKSKENWIYLVVSGILFIVLIALSIYGIRRRKT